MSYILEAIRRSDQQRRSAGTPAFPIGTMFFDGEHGRPLLSYAILAVALITAGVAIGWLRPWQHADAVPAPVIAEPAQPARLPPTPRPEQIPQPEQTPRPQPAPPAQQTAPAENVEELQVAPVKPYRPRKRAETRSAQSTKAAPPAAPAAVSTLVVTNPAPAQPAQISQPAQAAQPAPAQPAPPGAAVAASGDAAPGEGRVLALQELPPEILRAIPAMAITGYSYSETPRERMVGINDRLVVEGQYVAEGLKLEQITPDGLVFSYKNYRFRKKLQ